MLKQYTAESLSEYIEKTIRIIDDEKDVWFRGHSSASYRLIPSALRDTKPLTDGRGNIVTENQVVNSSGGSVTGVNPENMFFEFKTRAVPFMDRKPDNNFEWMFLMQHYGVPTRLIDWTTNALVALYFAIESPSKSEVNQDDELLYECSATEQFMTVDEFCSEGAAVFAVNPYALNEKSILSREKIYICEEPEKWDHYFDPMNKEGDNFLPIAVQSSHIDARIRSQSGHFTLHGANIWALDYYSELREIIHKIFIPHSAIEKMFTDLRNIGVNESFIYPGMDSLARDIKRDEKFNFNRKKT